MSNQGIKSYGTYFNASISDGSNAYINLSLVFTSSNNKYRLSTNNCVQFVYDALDYCDLGYVRKTNNRIRHIVPAFNKPELRKIEMTFYKIITPRFISGGSRACTVHYAFNDNGFHILDRYRLW